MKKHFFFDMDGTLTRSRTVIEPAMETALMKLIDAGADVVVVSGAKEEQIAKQIGGLMYEHVAILAQNGNVAVSSVGDRLWENKLNEEQKAEIMHFIRRLGAGDGDDLIQDRGCQISYSAIGHNAPLEKKEAYDPGGKWRKSQIDGHKHTIAELEKIGVRVAIGGTTCIDFYLHTKGENVAQFIKQRKWKKAECVYVGDALFEGGNDHSVVGVVPTMEIRDHQECLQVVRGFIDKV